MDTNLQTLRIICNTEYTYTDSVLTSTLQACYNPFISLWSFIALTILIIVGIKYLSKLWI